MGSIIYSCCQCGERKNTRLNPMSTFHICRIGRSASHRLLCGNIVEEKHKTRYIHLQNFSGVPNTKTVLALLATSWAIVQVALCSSSPSSRCSSPEFCWELERDHRMGRLFPLLHPGCLPTVAHLVWLSSPLAAR